MFCKYFFFFLPANALYYLKLSIHNAWYISLIEVHHKTGHNYQVWLVLKISKPIYIKLREAQTPSMGCTQEGQDSQQNATHKPNYKKGSSGPLKSYIIVKSFHLSSNSENLLRRDFTIFFFLYQIPYLIPEQVNEVLGDKAFLV